MRGTLELGGRGGAYCGIIPAHAGNTTSNWTCGSHTRDHPRTCGEHTNRDIYRELAVFGARVDQMATMTAAQAAQHDCLMWAVLGNKDIFGDPEPRVTPRQ